MINGMHPRHRLPRPYYLGLGAYFVTICAGSRRKLFTDAYFVRILVDIMREEFCHAGFSVGAYCVMPDHCHILAISTSETCDLARAVRAFKGLSTARARNLGIRNLWQRDYYDHIVRSGDSLECVAAYILANPVRAGLVADCHAWPFSGSFVFEWKKLPTVSRDFQPSWKKR